MKTILLAWTSGVTEHERTDLETGVRQVLDLLDARITVEAIGSPSEADRWQDEAATVAADRSGVSWPDLYIPILDYLARRAAAAEKPIPEAGAVVVVAVESDLLEENGDWLFGATPNEPGLVSMLSVRRLRDLDDEIRRSAFRRIARHEFAHLVGLIPPNRTERIVDTDWSIAKHCANVCTMRQTDVEHGTLELSEATREKERAGILFCPDCVSDLATLSLA